MAAKETGGNQASARVKTTKQVTEQQGTAVTGRSESEAGCGAAGPEEEDEVAATAEA